jgi:DNA invertase Pin-like site-specific DNA recombinase|tara:strand:+ start:3631 stop:3831 length:201 start_codon:yes stop_codon:yes gene_type:complete
MVNVDIKVKLWYNKTELDKKNKEVNKLSEARANLIKQALSNGWSVSAVAKELDISRQRVYKILKNV